MKYKKRTLPNGLRVISVPTKGNPAGERKEEFYGRLAGIIRDSPSEYFMRWKVEVTPGDVARFRRECLDPILEQLCDWWDWIKGHADPFDNDAIYNGDIRDGAGGRIHWRHPFGVWNPMDSGAESDLDEYLSSGSEVGLQRVNELFPELKGG